jgi:cell division protease FtsH
MRRTMRNSFIFVIIMVTVLVLVFAVLQPEDNTPRISFAEVVANAKAGQIANITAYEDSNEVSIQFTDPARPPVLAVKDGQESVATYLTVQGVTELPPITVQSANRASSWLSTLGFVLPTLFLIGVFVFMMRSLKRQMRPPAN